MNYPHPETNQGDHYHNQQSLFAAACGFRQPSRTKDHLAELIEKGAIIAEGANRNRVDRLK